MSLQIAQSRLCTVRCIQLLKANCPGLDHFEGKDYDRIEQFVVRLMTSEEEVNSITYVAKKDALDSSLKPFDWYKLLVIAGAREGKLPNSYIDWLKRFPVFQIPKLTASRALRP